jgi:phage regulator Rha-like protein
MYSKKYPKLACDMCFNAQKCPEYKAGYVCAYNEMFERYNTRDMADIIQAMQGLAEYQLVRVQRAMLTETVNGGMIDANTTAMMNQAMGMMEQLKSMYDISSREVFKFPNSNVGLFGREIM